MSIILKRRRRPGWVDPISNMYVEDQGHRYRVCRHGSHPIIVALKCAKGGERLLDIDGRRARQIIAWSNLAPAGTKIVMIDPVTYFGSQKGA